MHIVATSAGFRATPRMSVEIGPVLRYALTLTGKNRPRVCLLLTATGDPDRNIALAYAAFSGEDVTVSHLQLFPMPNHPDPRAHLLAQDLIWVGGGSVANLLAVWRTHGLDSVLRQCWEAGVVLGGVSAGSLCWHVGGTTDSFGPELRAVTNGLALLPYSNTPHYDSEPGRRPLYQDLVAAAVLPPGWATDDGVGLHFAGTEMVEVVSERPDAYAWRVEQGPLATAVETRLTPRLLPGAGGTPA